MTELKWELLADNLMKWYDIHQRDLPWRRNRDPYRTWVSEIMLQQTRVEAVIPYYERWMEHFPTAASLAAATEEEVLSHWQGLGYYSRARNLLRGVQEAVATYGGVPAEREAVAALTGVGEYTAGAILSMAYNQKEPALDGNVLRIFSRLALLETDIATAAAKKSIRRLVLQTMDAQRPGDFNQALMDLGSAVCVPRIPRCHLCPLTGFCQAYVRGRTDEVPVKRKKAPPQPLWLAAAVLANEAGAYLLHRRPDKGLLAGMWEFPAVTLPPGTEPTEELSLFLQRETGMKTSVEALFLELTHTFSHRRWHLAFYHCRPVPETPLPADWIWSEPVNWPKILFAGPHARAADQLSGTR